MECHDDTNVIAPVLKPSLNPTALALFGQQDKRLRLVGIDTSRSRASSRNAIFTNTRRIDVAN